jgi:ATP-dependent Clp protease adaptor protein ClpS
MEDIFVATDVLNKEKVIEKIKEPKGFKVVMHNDDFTTMEFVVFILISVFNKNTEDANRIMLDVHSMGRGIVGVYPYDIAMTKVSLVMKLAKNEGFPFKVTVEEA